MSAPQLKVLVAGLGTMGRSHALAYHRHPNFTIVGLVNSSRPQLDAELDGYEITSDYASALRALRPDVASISTYSDTHADYAVMALEQGAHVFVEKPLATTAQDARRVVAAARANGRKLIVGYILRHHPGWIRFIAEARALGGPYVFRMNLNQQSSGAGWMTHRKLMHTTPPIVDCGVHYVDVMCQITDAKAVEVRGMGLRLSQEIAPEMYNYGQFQVLFADGSVAWFESAFGPMISREAVFIKDVMSPNGSVSMSSAAGRTNDLAPVKRPDEITVHRSTLNSEGAFAMADAWIETPDPGRIELCERQQHFVYRAIVEDFDLSHHEQNSIDSLRIALAADESVRSGLPVRFDEKKG